MHRLQRHFQEIAASASYPMLLIVTALIIGPHCLPVQWSSNEINYFDLAHRFARPDLFTDHHSVFDHSNARALAFSLIGTTIDLFGFETAKTIFGLTNWALYALSLAALMRVLGMTVAQGAAALLTFLVLRQGLLSGEWLFNTVEAKTFAYPAVIFGIALAVAGRWYLAIVVAGISTGLHFLIGGFWSLTLIAFHFIRHRQPGQTAKLLGLFAALSSPVLLVLVTERAGAEIDMTGIDRSLSEIYGYFRTPHHVAPFAGGLQSIWAWMQSVIYHIALAAGLFVIARLQNDPAERGVYVWAALLNLYLLAAFIIAFFDRNTHIFAALYLFRPSSLILLISLILLARSLLQPTRAAERHLLYPAVLCLALLVSGLGFTNQFAMMVLKLPPGQRLEAQLSEDEREVVDWIRAQTAPGDALLIEPQGTAPSVTYEGLAFHAGAERLTGRGLIVNFKFVPTNPGDLVRWYRLIEARTALFVGDCSQLEVLLHPHYLVLRSPETAQRLAGCIQPLFENDMFLIAKTTR